MLAAYHSHPHLGTVVTSLPNTADPGEPYNLKRWLDDALFDDSGEASIQSVDDVVGTIVKICVDFFQREGPCGVRFQHCFQYSISAIVCRLPRSYQSTVFTDDKIRPRKRSTCTTNTRILSSDSKSSAH